MPEHAHEVDLFEAERQAARDFDARHADAGELLLALIDQNAAALGSVVGHELSGARLFRLYILSQSHQVALAALQQLVRGYARSTLLSLRFVSEGVVAAIWATEQADYANQCLEDFVERKAFPRGTWPNSEVMAKELPSRFDDDAIRIIQSFHNTENELYSHAVSDLSLVSTLGDDGVIYLVPRTNELSNIAARHFVPVLAILGRAVAELRLEVLAQTSEDLLSAIDRAFSWSANNPPELIPKRKKEG